MCIFACISSLFFSACDDSGRKEPDESETRAKAITSGGMLDSSVGPGSEPLELRFDHPFGFVVREKSTNAFVFADKIGTPI